MREFEEQLNRNRHKPKSKRKRFKFSNNSLNESQKRMIAEYLNQ